MHRSAHLVSIHNFLYIKPVSTKPDYMKFEAKHQGKWVAAKGDKIIANASTLNKLMQKVKKEEDSKNLKYSLVPKGFIAG